MKYLWNKFVSYIITKNVCTCDDAIGVGTHVVCGKQDIRCFLHSTAEW